MVYEPYLFSEGTNIINSYLDAQVTSKKEFATIYNSVKVYFKPNNDVARDGMNQ